MRRVADTVSEEVCVYTLPCGADNELYFLEVAALFWLQTFWLLKVIAKTTLFEMQAPASVHHNFTAKY